MGSRLPLPWPFSSLLSLPLLNILGDHPPASYPAMAVKGQLRGQPEEGGRENVGSKVHRQMQLQQGYVTPHEVVLVKVTVNSESIHCHLPALHSGMLEFMVPELDPIVRWFMGPVVRGCVITCLLWVLGQHPRSLSCLPPIPPTLVSNQTSPLFQR